ncbi:CPBP family intramembrane glutamic endopeptidase [Candidatus Lokiarchaeum ossiferum]|uniref:CPBP family intramembrane glutamic endopeptidase n=1 Tax=Candidatus Lokiarchaeum ossiferum TaxID=2951803 RepID=UPI00352C7D90
MGRESIRETESVGLHTWVSFITGILATGIMCYIGFKYIGAESYYDRAFGKWAFVHTFYCFCGLLLAPVILGESVIPQKPIKMVTVKHTVIIFLSIVWFQFFISMLSVSGTDRKLYHVFSAVSEELFYRAFMIPVLIKMFDFDNEKLSKAIAVLAQAIIFAIGHVNYWNDPIAMLSVFGGGLFLGFFYVRWGDITANIASHMGNNIVATGVFSV